jgi:hypothetical protein
MIVIACDKREAFAQGSSATKQSILSLRHDGLLRGVYHRARIRATGIPARNGFNGFLRTLPGDRAFLSPSSVD